MNLHDDREKSDGLVHNQKRNYEQDQEKSLNIDINSTQRLTKRRRTKSDDASDQINENDGKVNDNIRCNKSPTHGGGRNTIREGEKEVHQKGCSVEEESPRKLGKRIKTKSNYGSVGEEDDNDGESKSKTKKQEKDKAPQEKGQCCRVQNSFSLRSRGRVTEYICKGEKYDDKETVPQPNLNLSQNEALILKCAWFACKHNDTNIDSFAQHVGLHAPYLEHQLNAGRKEVWYNCRWHLCNFETRDRNEITRHIEYHSYHTALKCLGKNEARQAQLPKCNRYRGKRNDISELASELTCCWKNCKFSCNDPHMFYYHVEEHVKHQASGIDIHCSWANCVKIFETIPDLEKHVRTHTQEKMIACLSCGSMFESNPKFINHLILPVSDEVVNTECPLCQRIYPTLHELARHVSTLIIPIKCHYCNYRYYTQGARDLHMRSHESGKWLPDEKCVTAAPHILHPITPIDDGLAWRDGENYPIWPSLQDRTWMTDVIAVPRLGYHMTRLSIRILASNIVENFPAFAAQARVMVVNAPGTLARLIIQMVLHDLNWTVDTIREIITNACTFVIYVFTFVRTSIFGAANEEAPGQN